MRYREVTRHALVTSYFIYEIKIVEFAKYETWKAAVVLSVPPKISPTTLL